MPTFVLIEAALHICVSAVVIAVVCRDAAKKHWPWQHFAGIAFLSAQVIGVVMYLVE